MQYLIPVDLLHLARTDKAFRKFLLSRATLPLWKSAFAQVEGIPKCPPWLSEPAYASLAFENYCHRCGKTGTKMIYWHFGVRYCPLCRKHMLVKCDDEESCPYGTNCQDIAITHFHDSNRNVRMHYHHLPDVEEYEENAAHWSKEEADAYQDNVDEKMDFYIRCMDWQDRLAEDRSEQLESMKERRLEIIVKKLEELGWGEELEHMQHDDYESLRCHTDIWKAQELTDRVWDRICPRIEKYVGEIRDERLATDRYLVLKPRFELFVDWYHTWFAEQEDKGILPRPGEILRREEIVHLLDRPEDIDFGDIELWFHGKLPEWTQQWRDSCEDQLRAIVRGSPEYQDKLPADVDPLTLASVAFDCKYCARYRSDAPLLPPLPPYTTAHECLTRPSEVLASNDTVEQAVLAAARCADQDQASLGYMPWSSEGLTIGVWHRRACEVIRAAGKDPLTTTREEMDALEVRFWCRPCLQDCHEEKRQVMGWRDAIYHYVYHDFANNFSRPVDYAALPASRKLTRGVQWETMSGPVVQRIKEIEAVANAAYYDPNLSTNHSATWYQCSFCPLGWESGPAIRSHLFSVHGRTSLSPSPGEEYWAHPDAYMTMVCKPVYILKGSGLGHNLSEEDQQLLADKIAGFVNSF
ncbi:hypothetical protein PsYK624_125630 [Phanerochaete sordida]|uniref:Uncharacterized protein n=1 Tax=Phanerochaete sordida TaxID=48140 RepID=A0A9P3GK18_9APHY|nr:hypothetical protein PsYK624_125630 [Phanerochaete sordida]